MTPQNTKISKKSDVFAEKFWANILKLCSNIFGLVFLDFCQKNSRFYMILAN